MAYSRSYVAGRGVTLTRAQASQANKAQNAFIQTWEKKISKAEMTATLSGLAIAALEAVFKKSAYAAIPGYVVSALNGASDYEKKEVLRVANVGENELDKIVNMFLDNDNYTSITFDANYLAFKNLATGNTDFTIIASNVIPTKIQTKSGSILL